jgi:hypothetical protein
MPKEPKDKRPRIASSRSTKKAADSAPAEEKATITFPNLEEMIRNRAYEFYEQRGREPGWDQDDWFRAEAEVRAQFKQRTA